MEYKQNNLKKLLHERKNNSYFEVEKKAKPCSLVFWESENVSPYSKIHPELNDQTRQENVREIQ